MGIEAIIERQVAQWNAERAAARERGNKTLTLLPVVTISRQLGSGGGTVARKVAEDLDCSLVGYGIVDTVAGNLGLPKDILNCMDEKLKSQFKSWFDSSFCGEVDQDDYHRYMVAIIRSMAELGAVVFLGRGAAFVDTERRKINVRIIAPKPVRIERVMKRHGSTQKAAVDAIEKSDRERTKFIRKVFGKDWNDPTNYDLIINTTSVDVTHVSALVECAWKTHCDVYRSKGVACSQNNRSPVWA